MKKQKKPKPGKKKSHARPSVEQEKAALSWATEYFRDNTGMEKGIPDSARETMIEMAVMLHDELGKNSPFAGHDLFAFNKKADVTNAMLRIADSLAYVAAARHVYVVVDDSENEKARLFVKAKNNLAPDKHALRYMVGVRSVGNDPDTDVEILAPHVIWDSQHVEVTATEAMEAAEGGGSKRVAAREAEDFLKSKLAYGPVNKEEIEEAAEAQDISVKGALKRAKIKLQVRTWKEKGKIDGKWFWELPSPIKQRDDSPET